MYFKAAVTSCRPNPHCTGSATLDVGNNGRPLDERQAMLSRTGTSGASPLGQAWEHATRSVLMTNGQWLDGPWRGAHAKNLRRVL